VRNKPRFVFSGVGSMIFASSVKLARIENSWRIAGASSKAFRDSGNQLIAFADKPGGSPTECFVCCKLGGEAIIDHCNEKPEVFVAEQPSTRAEIRARRWHARKRVERALVPPEEPVGMNLSELPQGAVVRQCLRVRLAFLRRER